jgi:hypothetical protein
MDCANILFIDRETLTVKYSVSSTSEQLAFLNPERSVSGNKTSFLFLDANDTIYDISSRIGNKLPLYHVNFGKNQQTYKQHFIDNYSNFDLDIFTDAFINNGLKSVVAFFNNGKYLAINYIENDDSDVKYHGYGLKFRNQTVFYDQKKNEAYNTKNINFDVFNKIKNKKMWFVGCIDDYFAAILNEPFTTDEINEIVKSQYLPAKTKQAILDMNEDSNPIIFLFR